VRQLTRRTLILPFFILLTVFARAQTPTANFSASPVSGCSPLVVNLQDQSTGNVTGWFWDFGNGGTSTLQNPSTTYFTPGSYTIKLTVTNASGTHSVTRTNLITVHTKPVVSFTVSDSTACFPHRAQFTDLSSPGAGNTITNWLWDFGNGTQSTVQNPLNVYTASGNFGVTLRVTNDKGCFTALTKPGYIQLAGGIVADFTNNMPAVCKPPYRITFNNITTGTGTLTYAWDFGDGNTSTQQNPVHTYTTPGNYSVTMAVASSLGCTDTVKKTNLLNILNISTAITAPDSICVRTPVNIVNNSSPAPVSSVWTFGDATGSNQVTPTKIYNTPGTYTIRLKNTYSYCTDSASKTIKVLPRPVANFTSSPSTRCQPDLTVNFTNTSTNAIRWSWDFGDGNTSALQNPSHTYTNYGTYNVQLVVTNSSGCTDTLRKNALVRIIRPAVSINNLPVRGCIPYGINPTATIVTLDAVTSYLWDFGDGNTSTSATPSHTYATQGTYTVKLTITTSSGCTEVVTIGDAVKVGRKPVVNFSAAPPTVCAFKPVQFTDLTNEADEWAWFFGDGGTSTSQSPSYTYSDTGTFAVTLVATNNGCVDSLVVPRLINVRPPIALFNYLPDCNNRLRFEFRDSSIGATSWFWDFGDGTNSTEQNPVHTFPSYNTYNVTLTVSNDTCSNSITHTLRVFNEIIDFTVSEDTLCRRNTVTFIATASNIANIQNFMWDFGDGSPPWNSSVTGTGGFAYYLYPLAGSYDITLVTTDIYGCQNTLVKPRLINMFGPTANLNIPVQAGCKGLNVTFNDRSIGDGVNNIVQWIWDFGDGNTQTNTTNASVQHIYPNVGSYTIRLTVKDAFGCIDIIELPNFINISDPQASFVLSDTLSCPSSPIQFTNTSSVHVSALWDFGDGNTSTDQNGPAYTYTVPGTYTVKLMITDLYGCSDTLTRPALVTIDNPIASFTVSDSISSCTPFEVNFTNTSHFYRSLEWDLGQGVSDLETPTQYYINPGTYNITLTVTSAGFCKDVATKKIIVYDTTGTRITYAPLNGCKPLTVGLTAFSPGEMTYTWDFGDGTLINNDTTGMTHIYNFFGEFTPKVIMTDPSGCIIPVTGLDTIRIKGATVNFGWDKNLFCDLGQVSFTDSTTFNDSLIVYNWDFGDGFTSNLQHPTHQYDAPGQYTVSLNVQTLNGCADTMRVSNVIKVVESPIIRIDGDSVICVNELMDHLGVFERIDTSRIQWNWQFPNGNQSSLQNPDDQKYGTPGRFVITTIATNSSGCADTTTKNILVNPLPVITMPSTMTMQVGFPVRIPATYSPNVATWNWTPVTGLDCSDCPQPITSTKFNRTYTVSVVDSNSCRSSEQVQIIVICKNANVFVPNTFSPNNDGSNDVFYVRGKGLERVKSLRVFNRWGEVVFEQNNFPVNDPNYGWNGKFKGNKPFPDVYIYQVEVWCENSEVIRFEGNVALIQ
jgi:gliding motility-associated-like protein